jgi:hypothetical protein
MNRIRETIVDLASTAVAVLIEMLREIFDEAAYTRFLSRAGMASSCKAYAAFRQEFEDAKMRRPKCC